MVQLGCSSCIETKTSMLIKYYGKIRLLRCETIIMHTFAHIDFILKWFKKMNDTENTY